jgi:glycosyltransferase involved in cell wall biosynthesis
MRRSCFFDGDTTSGDTTSRSLGALSDSATFLRLNNDAYEWLVNRIQRMDWLKKKEATLREIEKAARFATEFYTGRFADGAIENVALEIGKSLGKASTRPISFPLPPVVQSVKQRRILHVVSAVFEIGGHTRMLYHWICNDRNSCHSVVLVNQTNGQVPQWLHEAVLNSGGSLVIIPSETPLCQKALWLREMARQAADLVVLHHFGSDVVPTVAFAPKDCPPVAVLNHADHLFWMGSSIADMVINLRTKGADLTAKRRFVSRNHVIPVPLQHSEVKMSRWDARQVLGMENDWIVMLSIGRPEKYRPCGPYDFVATAGKILERWPNAHLYVVGESVEGIAPYLHCTVHHRLHFVGSVENPSLYHTASDIYLESFPFGSQTALLEAALSGLPVVSAYAPLFPLLVAVDDALEGLLDNPSNERDYMERVELLIGQPEERKEKGEELRACLLIDHVDEGWLNSLATMYRKTDSLVHNPRPITISSCHMADSDISLSLWHIMAGRTLAPSHLEDTMDMILCHAALVAKIVGNYATARSNTWRAIRHTPYRLVLWRLLVVVLLGNTGKLIQWALRVSKHSAMLKAVCSGRTDTAFR